MILYHFTTSPFARRVRLALAHKGLSAELRDARADPEHMAEVRRLNPLHTVPVLIDGEHVVCDSDAICHYLERRVPAPPLWPAGLHGAEAIRITALTDSVINILSDLGMRYLPLHTHDDFPKVRASLVGRVQRALDRLCDEVTSRGVNTGPLCGEYDDAWSAADIAVFTMVVWLEGLHARAASFPPAKAVVGLGWSLPPALSEWANLHRQRPDVLALG